jgi:hypothetical protein
MIVIILIILAVIWLFSWRGPSFYPAYATIFEISALGRQLALVVVVAGDPRDSLFAGSHKILML